MSTTLSVAAVAALVGLLAYAAEGNRIGGATRYETSALLSQASYPEGAAAAVLVRGDGFADALTAGGYSGLVDGPVLLTEEDALPAVVRDELTRLKPGRVDIIGGNDAISTRVELAVQSLGISTDRVAGGDRYATGAGARYRWESVSSAVLVSGSSAVDAVAAGPAAHALRAPVLLTARDALPPPTNDALVGVQALIIIGGEDVVSADVERQAATASCPSAEPCRSVERVAGRTGAATAVAVADYFFNSVAGEPVTAAALVRADVVADALAGAPHAGRLRMPVVFATSPDALAPETRDWLVRNAESVDRVDVYGSPIAVTDAVWEEARSAAGP